MSENISLPKELATFEKHLSTVPKEDMEYLISSLWQRFHIEQKEKDEFHFNPDREVSGGDLVELVGELLEHLSPSKKSPK